jgi:3-oxoacyl-[acyl-carrier-protein] synthase II
VITGIGLITPAGRGLSATFDGQCDGRSGLTRPPGEHAVAGCMEFAGIAPDVQAGDVLPPPVDPCIDRYVVLGIAAADDALADAGLVIGENVDAARVGTVVSSGGGGLKTYEDHAFARRDRGRTAVSPYLAPGMLPNMAAARIAIKYGLRGYSAAVATACAAGAQSVAEGLRLIWDGEADVVVCGGADAPLHPTIATAFDNANAMAHGWADAAASSRPFDAGRNGFVLSEGAAIVVLERAEHADTRGAAGYADVLGWGATTDAYHLTAPRPNGAGAAECMRRALRSAGLEPSDIGYVNAHGTSTKLGDAAEARAIRTVFGKEGSPPVSATKSITGHTLGAAGAVEAAVTAVAIARGILPPTLNLEEVDRSCELDHVRGKPRFGPVAAAVSNSFGFGGHNVSLVLGQASTRATRFAEV